MKQIKCEANMNKRKIGDIVKVVKKYVQVDGKNVKQYSFNKEIDNIMYSTAFRRMSAKTQVFNSGTSDYLRTRLTHTLEVAQIARTISEELGLDVKLTEAIALAHDLGHTPFGHVGERCLHEFSLGNDRKYQTKKGEKVRVPEKMKGFKHNLQSVRLLKDYMPGCQFSNYLLYGVREHSGIKYKYWKDKDNEVPFYDKYNVYCSVVEGKECRPAWSFEAFVVKWADEIAQRHHDIEDAYYKGIMTPRQILKKLEILKGLFEKNDLLSVYQDLCKQCEDDVVKADFVHELSELIITTYTKCSVQGFDAAINKLLQEKSISNRTDFVSQYLTFDEIEIKKIMSLEDSELIEKDKELSKALMYAILDSYEVQRMDGRCRYIVRRLIRAYKTNAQQLPDSYIAKLFCFELKADLIKEESEKVFDLIKKELGYDTKDVDKWQNYEYRHALRTIQEDDDIEQIVMPILMRVVYDYVSMMSDSYAYKEYQQLYE